MQQCACGVPGRVILAIRCYTIARDAADNRACVREFLKVTSGAVALLLEERPNLRPGEASVLLQLTSSPIPSTGLLISGAGSLNVLAAAAFAADIPSAPLPVTQIGSESVEPATRSRTAANL